MNPNDVLIEMAIKIFIVFMILLAALSILDAILQIAIIING